MSGTSNQTFPGTLSLDQNGAAISGMLQSSFGTTKLTGGTVDADGFHFVSRAEIAGREVEMTIDGNADGNEIAAQLRSELGFLRFTGFRQR